MEIKNGVRAFEDNRWACGNQISVIRHILALPFVARGPVLDLGGGDGLFMALVKRHYGFEVRVLDVSPMAVRMAREKGLAADVVDITSSLPFEGGSFGTVCALDVLEHVYDPLSLLREMGRVGHSVVVSVPNFHFIVGRIGMLFGRIPFQSKPRRGHIYWFNYYVLLRMARDAGMRIERIAYGPIVRLGFFGRLFARFWPNIFADSFVALLVPISHE